MKKIALLLVTVFLNLGLFSCTPETVAEQSNPLACCDEEGNIPPPPPPPEGDGVGG